MPPLEKPNANGAWAGSNSDAQIGSMRASRPGERCLCRAKALATGTPQDIRDGAACRARSARLAVLPRHGRVRPPVAGCAPQARQSVHDFPVRAVAAAAVRCDVLVEPAGGVLRERGVGLRRAVGSDVVLPAAGGRQHVAALVDEEAAQAALVVGGPRVGAPEYLGARGVDGDAGAATGRVLG